MPQRPHSQPIRLLHLARHDVAAAAQFLDKILSANKSKKCIQDKRKPLPKNYNDTVKAVLEFKEYFGEPKQKAKEKNAALEFAEDAMEALKKLRSENLQLKKDLADAKAELDSE